MVLMAFILKTVFTILLTAEVQTSAFRALAVASLVALPPTDRQAVLSIRSVTLAMEQESASIAMESVVNGRMSALIRVPTRRNGVTVCRATALESAPSATAGESFDSHCCSAIPVYWIR